MSLIEGIGDEVTFVFAALLVILLVVCAWLSTHTRDIPFFSLLIVELTGRRNRTPEPSVTTESDRTDDINNVTAEAPASQSSDGAGSVNETDGGTGRQEEEGPSEPTEVDSAELQTLADSSPPILETGPGSTSDVVATKSSTAPVVDHIDPATIRQRRLAFLSKNKDSTTCEQSVEVRGEDTRPLNNTSPSVNTPQSDVNEDPVTQPITQPRVVEEIDLDDGNIRVKLKYLNDDHRLVQTNPQETIGQFKRTHFGPELAANKLVRLIFNGQCLQNETSTLQSYNIRDNCTVHCLVTEARQQPSHPPQSENRNDLDIGVFMFPLFAVFLAIIWYFRFAYRQYFNAMTTFSLVGITFLFSVAVFSAWRTRHGREEHQHLE